jgi:hypothetical protein
VWYFLFFVRPVSGITFFMYAHNQKIGKPNNLKVFGASKPKGLNRIAKIDYGQIFLRQFSGF